MVVRAIGYRSLPLPELPFDDRRCVLPNREGRLIDPETGEQLRGLYAVGWVKRGPTGLIGSNKPDGAETAASMVADLDSTPPAPEPSLDAVDRLLAERGARPVCFADWQRIDRAEVEAGASGGRPRVKFCRVEDMLAALD
jgi:ferredoxin--NADP+ reductase